jgi:hypothetical protein
MFHRWAALVLVLAFWAMSPKNAAGQGKTTSPRGPGAGAFGNPHPNPFNPEVHIPFTVGDSACTDGSQQHEVSLQIKNILSQVVAIPLLEAATQSVSSSVVASADGRTPIARLRLGCGNYSAYWSGNVQGSGKEAASGTYVVVLIVDGSVKGTTRIFNRK